MPRLRCLLGLHRWQLLYAHTGDGKNPYQAEVLCLFCRKPAPARAWGDAVRKEARRIWNRLPCALPDAPPEPETGDLP